MLMMDSKMPFCEDSYENALWFPISYQFLRTWRREGAEYGVNIIPGWEPANHDEIIDFLTFTSQEPMNIFIGLLEPGYRIPYFDKMVRQQLSEEGTVVVVAWERNVLMGMTTERPTRILI